MKLLKSALIQMGGGVAGDFAQTCPEAVKSLVMVGAALTGWPLTHFWPTLLPIIEVASSGDIARAKRMWVEHELFAPARREPQVFAHFAQMLEDYSGWFFANFPQNPERKPPTPTAQALQAIRIPTLVIVGELDLPDFLDMAEAIATGMPNARKVVVQGAGHLTNAEKPREFNRALLEFFAECE